MNDQQHSTPQPFDDGPRSTVDPHLLPAATRAPRVQLAPPAAPEQASVDAHPTPADESPDAQPTSAGESPEAYPSSADASPVARPVSADASLDARVNEAPAQSDAEDTIDPNEFIDEAPTATEESRGSADALNREAATGETPQEEADVTLTTDSSNASEPAEGTAAASANTANTDAATAAGTTDYGTADGAGYVAAASAGAAASTGRSRLDEALERSRTIPYEAPVPPAAEDEPNTAADTAVLGSDKTKTLGAFDGDPYPTDSYGAGTADTASTANTADADTESLGANSLSAESLSAEEMLANAERRRDDKAFEDAMLGVTSTEGLIVPPSKRGNRTFALIFAVITTLVFAAFYAFAFSTARFIFTPGADILGDAWTFVGTAAFYVPVALFAVIMIVWSVISNRAGWWSYILASVILAIVAFGGHYVGLALQDVINGGTWSMQGLFDAMRAAENLPGALIAFIAARESANWIGGLIAARGRRVNTLNKRDMADYERRVAEERELSGISNPSLTESNLR